MYRVRRWYGSTHSHISDRSSPIGVSDGARTAASFKWTKADEILGLGLGGIYPSSKNRRPQFLTRYSPIPNTNREQACIPYSQFSTIQTQRPWINNRCKSTLTNSPTTTSETCSNPSTTRCRNPRSKNVRLFLFSNTLFPSPSPNSLHA